MPAKQFKSLYTIPPRALQSFWRHFIVGGPNECWPWLGAIHNVKGYGYLKTEESNWLVPRVAYYIYTGIDPDQYLICHRCDNPPCINPSHLFLGTQGDNARDRERKGRTVFIRYRLYGEMSGLHKLTWEIVAAAKQAHASGTTYAVLARQYNVSFTTIWNAIRGNTWKPSDHMEWLCMKEAEAHGKGAKA